MNSFFKLSFYIVVLLEFGAPLISTGNEVVSSRPFFSTNSLPSFCAETVSDPLESDPDFEIARDAFFSLCPTMLVSTNVLVESQNPDFRVTDPRTLTGRLISFATERRDHRRQSIRPPILEKKRPGVAARPTSFPTDNMTDAELAAGEQQNSIRRSILLSYLRDNADNMENAVLMEWYDASVGIWVMSPLSRAGDWGQESIRRAKDGIPSAEAILEWFAENEAFCESVRADAKARLESLKKKSAPQPDAQPVSTTAAEGREQDARPVPEDVSSTAPNETEENKAP